MDSVFDQLQAVVHGDPPFLKADFYSLDLVDFVNKCLIKETSSRPKYTELMEHNFFKKNNVLDADRMLEERSTFGSYVARFPSD
uniref:Uncharacterized protein n=1 Tax=Ditylenchus dipsaci TaxID=166011 RepID=A0A915DP99_9BILA